MPERQPPGDGAGRPGQRGHSLVGLAAIFLRLGLISFGGPAAHIALMRDEFVRRRGWLDDPAFLDILGAANVIPGPTSTELAMHIGYRRRRGPGLLVAGLAFLLPAVVIVGVLAHVYVVYGHRPELAGVLSGVAPIVVAVVAHAGWSIGRAAIRSALSAVVFVVSVVALLAGVPEVVVLLAAGGIVVAIGVADRSVLAGLALAVYPGAAVVGGGLASLPAIFITFFKIGAVMFGSGYVLIAFLRAELVEGLGWLSEGQLVDAIAVGQATPGPLFSTATFIGYVVGGTGGAVAATVGVFLPAFLAVALSIPLLHRVRGSRRARAFLDGINVGALALIAVVAGQLAFDTLRDGLSLVVAGVAFGLLARGVGTGRLVLGGAVLGLIRLAVAPQ